MTTLVFALILVAGCGMIVADKMALAAYRNGIWPGAALVTLGLVGVLWPLNSVWAEWRRTQRLRADQQERSIKKALRRVREAEEQLERKKRRLERSAMESRAHDAAAAQRKLEREKALAQAAMQRALDDAATREALRLLTLTDGPLMDAVENGFLNRGYRVKRLSEDALCDMLLYLGSERAAVVRCVPHRRRGESEDVHDAEAWRVRSEAPECFLVAVQGFSPAAVREARERQVTLVEAHLLAGWLLINRQPRIDA